MKHGIFLGLSTIDIINYVSHYPSKNEKLKAEMQLNFAGGPATNAAIAFASFGNKCSLITGLGNHPLTALARQDIETHNVKLVDLILGDEKPIISSINVDLTDGDRTVVYTNTGNRLLLKNKITESLIHSASIILVDGFYMNSCIHIAKLAKKLKIPVVLDGGSWKENMNDLLPYVDYAICSNNFLPPKCKTKENVFEYLKNESVENIAITRGANSTMVFLKNKYTEIIIPKTEVVDTLGAGDIFHGAFCYFILQEKGFIKSLEKATYIASLSCKYYGTREWIGKMGDLE